MEKQKAKTGPKKKVGKKRGNLSEICGYGCCKIKIKVNAKDNTRNIQKLCENIMQLLLLSGFINE